MRSILENIVSGFPPRQQIIELLQEDPINLRNYYVISNV